jgi:hypothetical protein
MARKNSGSPALSKLNARVLGLKSIQEDLVLKNGLSTAIGTDIQVRLKSKLDQISIQQSLLDQSRIELKALEKEANAFSKNSLAAVKNDFGDDAIEVTKTGGVRMSDRAKPVTKAKKAEKAALKAANKAAKKA